MGSDFLLDLARRCFLCIRCLDPSHHFGFSDYQRLHRAVRAWCHHTWSRGLALDYSNDRILSLVVSSFVYQEAVKAVQTFARGNRRDAL